MRVPLADYKKFNGYAWPGGYTITALMADSEPLCYDCITDPDNPVTEDVNSDDSAWRYIDCFIHWEGPPLYCAHCNKVIESEYGDPGRMYNE